MKLRFKQLMWLVLPAAFLLMVATLKSSTDSAMRSGASRMLDRASDDIGGGSGADNRTEVQWGGGHADLVNLIPSTPKHSRLHYQDRNPDLHYNVRMYGTKAVPLPPIPAARFPKFDPDVAAMCEDWRGFEGDVPRKLQRRYRAYRCEMYYDYMADYELHLFHLRRVDAENKTLSLLYRLRNNPVYPDDSEVTTLRPFFHDDWGAFGARTAVEKPPDGDKNMFWPHPQIWSTPSVSYYMSFEVFTNKLQDVLRSLLPVDCNYNWGCRMHTAYQWSMHAKQLKFIVMRDPMARLIDSYARVSAGWDLREDRVLTSDGSNQWDPRMTLWRTQLPKWLFRRQSRFGFELPELLSDGARRLHYWAEDLLHELAQGHRVYMRFFPQAYSMCVLVPDRLHCPAPDFLVHASNMTDHLKVLRDVARLPLSDDLIEMPVEERGGVYSHRGHPYLVQPSDVAPATRRLVCAIYAIDYVCGHLPAPAECADILAQVTCHTPDGRPWEFPTPGVPPLPK